MYNYSTTNELVYRRKSKITILQLLQHWVQSYFKYLMSLISGTFLSIDHQSQQQWDQGLVFHVKAIFNSDDVITQAKYLPLSIILYPAEYPYTLNHIFI